MLIIFHAVTSAIYWRKLQRYISPCGNVFLPFILRIEQPRFYVPPFYQPFLYPHFFPLLTLSFLDRVQQMFRNLLRFNECLENFKNMMELLSINIIKRNEKANDWYFSRSKINLIRSLSHLTRLLHMPLKERRNILNEKINCITCWFEHELLFCSFFR